MPLGAFVLNGVSMRSVRDRVTLVVAIRPIAEIADTVDKSTLFAVPYMHPGRLLSKIGRRHEVVDISNPKIWKSNRHIRTTLLLLQHSMTSFDDAGVHAYVEVFIAGNWSVDCRRHCHILLANATLEAWLLELMLANMNIILTCT